MTYKETNEVIPTAEQERRDRKARYDRLYRERVTHPIDTASSLLAKAAAALRYEYDDMGNGDKAYGLSEQLEDLLTDLRERETNDTIQPLL